MNKWIPALIVGLVCVGIVVALMITSKGDNETKVLEQSFNSLTEPVNITINNTGGYLYQTTGTNYVAYFKDYSNWGDGVKYCVNTSAGQKCLIYQPQDMSYRDVYGSQDYLGNIANQQATINNTQIIYPNIFPNVTLQYNIYNNELKENYIIKEKPREPATYLTPPITLDIGGYIKYDEGITLILPNGTDITGKNIRVKSKIYFKYDGKTIFTLPIPIMYSTKPNESLINQSVGEYEIQKKGNQIWFYTKIPYELIENGSYPLIIDPTILSKPNSSDFYFEFEDTNEYLMNYGSSGINGSWRNGNGDGVLINGTYNTTIVKQGTQSGQFNGSSWVRIDEGSSYLDYTDFMLSLWVYETTTSSEQVLFATTEYSGGRVQISMKSGYVALTIGTEGWDWWQSPRVPFTLNQWTHLTVWANSTEIGVMTDNGTTNTTKTITRTGSFTGDVNNYISLGFSRYNNAYWIVNGKMDCVSFTFQDWNASDLTEYKQATCLNNTGGEPPTGGTNNWIDCTSNPKTNESKSYNSTFFINGTGTWTINHNVILNNYNKSDCSLILDGGNLTLNYG